jgi:hypothetical protein
VGLGSSASGTGLNIAGISNYAYTLTLAIAADGNPVVAWTGSGPGGSDVYLVKWDGSAWVGLGGSNVPGGLNGTTYYVYTPNLAVGKDGTIHAFWTQYVPFPVFGYYIYMKYWDGSSWKEYGGSATGTGIDGGKSAFDPWGAVASDNKPLVAWKGIVSPASTYNLYVKKWDGTKWIGLAGSDAGPGITGATSSMYMYGPRIMLDADDKPTVVWSGYTSPSKNLKSNTTVFAKRFDGTAWAGLGGSDKGLAGALFDAAAYGVSGADGAPIVAWHQHNVRDEIYVKRWDGWSWEPIVPDNADPDTSITTKGWVGAAGFAGGIRGTASDDTVAASVEITLRRASDGMYWDGADWVGGETWVKANGATDWVYPFKPAHNEAYDVQARAYDLAGKADPTPAASSFQYDGEPPKTALTDCGALITPSMNAVSGTASDSGIGTGKVYVLVQRQSDGMYWDGSGWTGAPKWHQATGFNGWQFAFTPEETAAYTLKAYAVDDAGNQEMPPAACSFNWATAVGERHDDRPGQCNASLTSGSRGPGGMLPVLLLVLIVAVARRTLARQEA